MRRYKEKLKSDLKLSTLTKKVLRLLRVDAKFSVSSIDQENFAHEASPINIYQDSQRELGSALLEAERKKAEALMEWQKHPRLY